MACRHVQHAARKMVLLPIQLWKVCSNPRQQQYFPRGAPRCFRSKRGDRACFAVKVQKQSITFDPSGIEAAIDEKDSSVDEFHALHEEGALDSAHGVTVEERRDCVDWKGEVDWREGEGDEGDEQEAQREGPHRNLLHILSQIFHGVSDRLLREIEATDDPGDDRQPQKQLNIVPQCIVLVVIGLGIRLGLGPFRFSDAVFSRVWN
mmetsp:Transcript_9807/g.19863  ORF Transcript_9807/g.19863 Transcript_9807/m.19863 type:complete len:206 (+) Transcript_9807:960-1577(+)